MFIYESRFVMFMQPKLRLSDFTPSKEIAETNTVYKTHIVCTDETWDWKPLTVEVSNTWTNLHRRARGEA